jgi:hypothetical protein
MVKIKLPEFCRIRHGSSSDRSREEQQKDHHLVCWSCNRRKITISGQGREHFQKIYHSSTRNLVVASIVSIVAAVRAPAWWLMMMMRWRGNQAGPTNLSISNGSMLNHFSLHGLATSCNDDSSSAVYVVTRFHCSDRLQHAYYFELRFLQRIG